LLSSGGKSVAIAYDSRNNSSDFGKVCAQVLAASGIKAYLFPTLEPTPVLSFAVRYLGCDAGIVVTASHNPKNTTDIKYMTVSAVSLLPFTQMNLLNM
ncbi:MAG: phospho-sugar mutase, partial [Clostridia bacterium]|nr:phospho-sugar mutase [Clostridia bacterium]